MGGHISAIIWDTKVGNDQTGKERVSEKVVQKKEWSFTKGSTAADLCG